MKQNGVRSFKRWPWCTWDTRLLNDQPLCQFWRRRLSSFNFAVTKSHISPRHQGLYQTISNWSPMTPKNSHLQPHLIQFPRHKGGMTSPLAAACSCTCDRCFKPQPGRYVANWVQMSSEVSPGSSAKVQGDPKTTQPLDVFFSAGIRWNLWNQKTGFRIIGWWFCQIWDHLSSFWPSNCPTNSSWSQKASPQNWNILKRYLSCKVQVARYCPLILPGS